MTRRLGLGLCGLALAAGAGLALTAQGPATATPAVAPAVAPSASGVVSGVTTHFAQGWPPRLLPVAQDLGVAMIRDSIHWPLVEKVPGRYDFTAANSGHVGRACAAGITVLLVLEPRNPLYDGKQTPFTPTAQNAFAAYVRAIADRWPGCVVAVEIGNEINGKGGMIGPAATNRIASHIALLKAVHLAVKPAHPGLILLGGSVNTVAGGFLKRLIAAGGLRYADGLAIHPYRQDPESVQAEIERLQAAMDAAAPGKTIWATEFSREFAGPEDAAPFYLKMTALMQSAGVDHHLWYALADQRFFPTMGLVRLDGSIKPGGEAFRFAARTLGPLGPARRLDEGDPALFHFRYGTDAHVVWGAGRALKIEAMPGQPVRLLRADGRPASGVSEVSDAPLVILGARSVTFGPARVLADSLYGFGQAPLEWAARTGAGKLVPLALTDWQWTSYLGNPAVPQAMINQQGIGAAPGLASVVRYRAATPAPLFASVCLKGTAPGGAARASVERNGTALWSANLSGAGATARASLRIAPAPGDRIDLVIAADTAPAVRLRYRWRIALDPADAAPCPEDRTP